jgi:mannose-1-phosphate guanylyltransferase
MRKENLIVQPENRGAAAAILYSLLRLSKFVPTADVALFPSDHFVSDDRHFMRHVDLAFDAVALRPELTVLLGITADCAETGYGWIEPGQPLAPEHANVFWVHRFQEKPSADRAKQLLERGCLWNSFVIVARVSTLLGLIILTLPELYRSFRRISDALVTSSEERSISKLYAALPHADFSHDVLARNPVNLAVLPVRGVEWSDPGEPARVRGLLARLGIQPQWDAA